MKTIFLILTSFLCFYKTPVVKYWGGSCAVFSEGG